MTRKDRKERDSATILAIIRFVLVIAIVVAAIFLGFKVFFFLTPILIGLVLAKAAVTTANSLARRLKRTEPPSIGVNKVSRALAIFFYYLFFILILLFISIFVLFVIRTLTSLTKDLPQLLKGMSLSENIMQIVRNISRSLGDIIDEVTMRSIEQSIFDLQKNLVSSLPQLLTTILGAITDFFSSLPNLILVSVITVMSGFYFITQTNRLYLIIRRLIPNRDFVRRTFTMINNLTSTLFRIIGGYLILLIITFVEAYIGLLVLSIPNTLAWALVTALIDFLPILGVAFTLIPMSIVYLISGQILTGLGIIALFVIMTIIRRLIEPAILGNAMQLHPVMTLMSMIVGIAIMGLSGIFLGPLLFVIAREIYITFELEAKIRNMLGEIFEESETLQQDTDDA
jgi:sporulation integral membrane protein YtvI